MPFCCTLELKGNLRNVTSELFIFTSEGFLKTILCSYLQKRGINRSFTFYFKIAHFRVLCCENNISKTFLIYNWRIVISQGQFIPEFNARKLKLQEPYSCDHRSVSLHFDGLLWGQYGVMTSLYLDTTVKRILHSRLPSC